MPKHHNNNCAKKSYHHRHCVKPSCNEICHDDSSEESCEKLHNKPNCYDDNCNSDSTPEEDCKKNHCKKNHCKKNHCKKNHCKKNHCYNECDNVSSSSSEDDCNNNCLLYVPNNCNNRDFINCNNVLRSKLGELQYKKPCKLPCQNEEEIKYKCYNYNGEFHKSLTHCHITGKLKCKHDYTNMVEAQMHNNQKLLASIPLNPGSQMKLVNPLASLSSVLVGAPQPSLFLAAPPKLSSPSAGADMVENYSMVLARDVPFTSYSSDLIIAKLLDSSHMNSPDVLSNLLYKSNGTFGTKTLFRGMSNDELVGPYISQLLLLNIPMGDLVVAQKYKSLATRIAATGSVEWGVNRQETIAIQNGLISSLPPLNPINVSHLYIHNGRSLAEAAHNDGAYQYYYQAAQLLNKLGVKPNPGFPVYPNQNSFITGPNSPDVLCSIGTVTELSLKHAWYWKFQLYRKLRPETFGLWIDNIKFGIVANHKNYDISNVILHNAILSDINLLYGSFTQPLCYPEGAPIHPSYPAGHAVIAGACCTLLKIFYDCNHPWSSLPGVIAGTYGPVVGAVQADSTGNNLIAYTDPDYANMTINGEINKLASNVSLGRDWAGVHYRSDGMAGILLGEEIAVKYMEDMLTACVENNLNGTYPTILFTKFDGSIGSVKPTIK